MTQQLKRIDPYWHTHPMIPVGVAIGAILGLAGYVRDIPALAIAAAVIASVAILAAAKPALSAVLGALGLAGGVLTFLVVPNLSVAGMSVPLKLVAALMFALFYMVLMDALVLVLCVLYNFFSSTLGLQGVCLELDSDEDAAPPTAAL